MQQRWFYAIEYAPGYNRHNLTYPFTVVVHRYPAASARTARVKIERAKEAPGTLRWQGVQSSHPLVKKANKAAEAGAQWPYKITVHEPQPKVKEKHFYAREQLMLHYGGESHNSAYGRIHRFDSTHMRDLRVSQGGHPTWKALKSTDDLIPKAKAKAMETGAWPVEILLHPELLP